ncbi:hypothetical protein V500_00462 [Pseudogymnoascus sp. VKM F-4518 (FW-2643)]|nr:hypothetical protein V500_00462 [Pseudogymnoascus sp. VKM F-4518 (FW-2643)]
MEWSQMEKKYGRIAGAEVNAVLAVAVTAVTAVPSLPEGPPKVYLRISRPADALRHSFAHIFGAVRATTVLLIWGVLADILPFLDELACWLPRKASFYDPLAKMRSPCDTSSQLAAVENVMARTEVKYFRQKTTKNEIAWGCSSFPNHDSQSPCSQVPNECTYAAWYGRVRGCILFLARKGGRGCTSVPAPTITTAAVGKTGNTGLLLLDSSITPRHNTRIMYLLACIQRSIPIRPRRVTKGGLCALLPSILALRSPQVLWTGHLAPAAAPATTTPAADTPSTTDGLAALIGLMDSACFPNGFAGSAPCLGRDSRGYLDTIPVCGGGWCDVGEYFVPSDYTHHLAPVNLLPEPVKDAPQNTMAGRHPNN